MLCLVPQSCPTLCDPKDCSPPGSSIPGDFPGKNTGVGCNKTKTKATQPQSLGWEDPLEKEMATHSSIPAWRIPWTEEPGRLQSMGLQRAGHDQVTNTFIFIAELQNRPPRDISTWYVDYFMLKAMETLRFKRNHCPPFNYLEEFVFFFFPKQNYYQREILFK